MPSWAIYGNEGLRGPVFPAAAAAAPFTFIEAAANGSSSGNGVTSDAINSTGAGLLIVGVTSFLSATEPTLTDSKVGNSWTGLGTSTLSPLRCRIWYSIPTSVGTGHTASLDGTGNFPTIVFAAFGGGAAVPFDVQNGATGAGGSTFQPGSITPGFDDELLIALLSVNEVGVTATIDGGFTIADAFIAHATNNFGGGLAWLIQTTATSANPTWTGSSPATQWANRIASFKKS